MNGNKGLTTGSALAVIIAALGLAVAFGVHISAQERDAIIAFATAVIAVAPSIGALFDHSHRQAESRVEAANVAASTLAPLVEPPPRATL